MEIKRALVIFRYTQTGEDNILFSLRVAEWAFILNIFISCRKQQTVWIHTIRTMDGRTVHVDFAEMLKCVCETRRRIDELLNGAHGEISIPVRDILRGLLCI